ncbi:MAG: putative cytochrome bd menaquinol oxidase subunit I [Stenotrophomonas maltophilia]|uniref:Putative cytochrome bd menaquinol oxidase subunit I n=1 Tax=Stenotrophomonas maltophilia TaxID=40324 RepID=A0A7V8FDD4_STEMA|nr:MAG: putative cytochrome bd menaquinol oxidase subunit I [Stenotrophomonas maltophilia]
MVNGIVHPVDWWQVVFNPSFPYRLAHMALGSFITTCFVIGGVGAWYLRRGTHVEAGRRMLTAAVVFAALTVPVQIFVGDMHGLNTLKHQPMKVAAMEGHWHEGEPGKGLPLVVFGVPNAQQERNDFEVAIPRVGSVILTHTLDGTIAPLTSVPASERPPVTPVFFAFRIMVGLGTLMLLLAWVSALQLRRGRLLASPWLLRGWNLMLPVDFIALLSGWFVTEMGRQPWVVYGVLRTADAVGPQSVWMTVLSLAVYVVGYAFVFGWGIWYLVKILRQGPKPHKHAPSLEGGGHTPARPLSAADEPLEER